MRYTAAHGVAESDTRSEEGLLTATDTTGSDDDSDNGGDDFFASSPESEPKSEPPWKKKSAPAPRLDNDDNEGDDESVPSQEPRHVKSDSDSGDTDRYSYGSESAASESEKESDASSESASSSGSSDDSEDSSGDEEATAERSSKASSASAFSEVKVLKQTKTKEVQKAPKALHVSLLDLYPKSLSLVGLNSRTEQTKEVPPSRPKSSASARPSLQTRVLRRSESLEEFTASLPERFKRNGWSIDNFELLRLNKAVYEAWYFHKEEQKERLKREAEEKALQDKIRKPRKLFQKTVPRKTKRLKMSEKVKMNIDQEDPEWKWLETKLTKMKKAKLASQAKAKEEQETREKKEASKLEEGAMAFAAWKTKKDEIARQKRREERQQAKEKAQAAKEEAEENRISANKVFEQYQQQAAAVERQEARRRRQQQRRLADRTAQLLEARDRQAQSRYHQWLQDTTERDAERSESSSGRHTPPPPRPPWYPAGALGGGRQLPEAVPRRSARPCRPGGGRGWRPCHQAHCPVCPCAPAATAVASSSRPDVLLTVDQPVSCASHRAVFVLRCLFCGLQYVGWTPHSVRAAFARQLRALQEEDGSTLAEHITEHRRQSDRFVPLTDCLLLTGVRAFPKTASRHAVSDFAHVAKEILDTVSPAGLNLH